MDRLKLIGIIFFIVSIACACGDGVNYKPRDKVMIPVDDAGLVEEDSRNSDTAGDTSSADSGTSGQDPDNGQREDASSNATDPDAGDPDAPMTSDAGPPPETCGNGVMDQGETCDGNCLQDCDFSTDSCSAYELVGSPDHCNVECVETSEIWECIDDDGCCPDGCEGDDSDCFCQGGPRTCADIGQECGSMDNLCGDLVDCGSCPSGTCVDGSCQMSANASSIGQPCNSLADCGSDATLCDSSIAGGTCTASCIWGVSSCPTGSTCAFGIAGTQTGRCMPLCTTDADCPMGLGCYGDLLSSQDRCSPST